MYKAICYICGKVIHRDYRLKKPICNTCKRKKNYKYKKKGYADTFIERNKLIYLKRKSGATYNELVKIFKLSRIRLSVIIRRERIKDGNEIFISKEDSKV